jgi:hypothetical protein
MPDTVAPIAAPAAAAVAPVSAPVAETTAAPVAPPAASSDPAAPNKPASFRGIFREKMKELKAEQAELAEGATGENAQGTDDTIPPADRGSTAGDEAGKAKTGTSEGDGTGGEEPSGGEGEPSSAPAPKLIQHAKYELVDSEGTPQSVAWPEGVALELKPSEGKAHQVKDFDELASLAVQGLELRRVVARKGNEIQQIRSQFHADRLKFETENEETLLAVVFDDEVRDQLQEKLAAFRDPAVRKLAQENRATKAAEAASAAEHEEAAAEQTTQLYAIADARFGALLREFPHLVADDALAIKQALHAKYLSARQTQGDDAAIRGAFNDTALRSAMDELNARYAKRLGKPAAPPPVTTGSPAAPPAPAKGSDVVARAAQHNARVDAALENKPASRSMRGAGAPPVGGDPEPKPPASWEEGKARRKALFAAVAQEP